MPRTILWALSVCVLPAVVQAQPPSDSFYEARRILAPECADGYLDSCEDLTRIAVRSIYGERGPRLQWAFAKLLLRACRADYDPACSALVRIGKEYAVTGDAEGVHRGSKLLARVCQMRPEIGCGAALILAEELSARPADPELGIDMLNDVCLAGEHGACRSLLNKSLPDPHGAGDRRVGRIASYAGLGVALAAAVGWAAAFSQDRCGTRSHRADEAFLYSTCTVSYVGFVAGTAASFVGTKFALNGQVRGRASDGEATGNSVFLWLGLGLGTVGAALPGGIELLRRDWRPGIAWSPLVFGAAAQVCFFLARWLGPSFDDDAPVTLVPAVLPVAGWDGDIGSTIGAQLIF